MFRLFFLLFALSIPRLVWAAPDPTQAYTDFMRDHSGFSWRLISRGRGVTTLEMTSQKWKESLWKHRMVIYQPQELLYPDAAALFLTTQEQAFDSATGRDAADAIGAPFVMVYDVPNEPLWNQSDDALLNYTVSKAIATGDASWSLAFPMAKTAVRAIDAINIYNSTSDNPEARPIARWLLIGFASRGMASWLAATDPRVKGLVSLSYNNLNTPAQVEAQRADWGELSAQLKPAMDKGGAAAMNTPRAQETLKSWDGYFFRDKLDKPKLVVAATGDDSWSLRAFDQYADEMPGVTNLLMVTGTDHYMANAFDRVIGAATAWCRWSLSDKALPQPKLTHAGTTWQMDAPGARAGTLNWAQSQTDDFRGAQWQKMPMHKASGEKWEAVIPKDKGELAVFAQGDWGDGEQTLPLSSRVVIDKN